MTKEIICRIAKRTIIVLLITSSLLLTISGCKKLVDVNSPTTNITGENVFTNEGTATAVMTGIYTQISTSPLLNGELISIGFLTGLAGDELFLYDKSFDRDLNNYFINNLNPNVQYNVWNSIYPKLFVVNSIIEKVPSSQSLSLGVKKQLLGEAKFMRAFLYIYLVELYGDVPLVTSTDYKINSVLARTSHLEVWAQIISDLKEAQDLLSAKYVDGTLLTNSLERLRPNKWAATALLARSYLYTGDWKKAEDQSTAVISNMALYHLDSLDNVFQKNNPEAIWQLQPVNFGSNTEDAKTYLINSTGFTRAKPVYMNPKLVNSFEIGDKRKTKWVDSTILSNNTYYFASKYKSDSLNAPITEYNTVLRLAEQYLIRAEARAQQNNLVGALADLNIIRQRAWLEKSVATSKDLLLTAIYHERRVELFTEWGHRWLDLKRAKLINAVMSVITPLKGGTWSSNWQFFPIPSSEIIADTNLSQNEGY